MSFKIVFNNKKLGKVLLNNVTSFSSDYKYYVSVVNEENGYPVVTNMFKSDIISMAVLDRSCTLQEGQELKPYDATVYTELQTLNLKKAFSERIENGYLVLSEISGFSKDQRTMFYTDHYIDISSILKVAKYNIESCTVEFSSNETSENNSNDSIKESKE